MNRKNMYLANESKYWIELLYKSYYIDEIMYESTTKDLDEIQKILVSIIISTKKNL